MVLSTVPTKSHLSKVLYCIAVHGRSYSTKLSFSSYDLLSSYQLAAPCMLGLQSVLQSPLCTSMCAHLITMVNVPVCLWIYVSGEGNIFPNNLFNHHLGTAYTVVQYCRSKRRSTAKLLPPPHLYLPA